MRLHHYTCRDMARKIINDGKIVPNTVQPFPGPRGPIPPGIDGLAVVWLTTLDRPDVHALGLTSHILSCDRTEVRFDVDVEAESWDDFARRVNSRWARNLARHRRPWTWWLYHDQITEFDCVPMQEGVMV